MKIDILAIGVHPDDVELGCSGTLMSHIEQQKKVVILDLTEGELGTRGTVATRYKEASEAQEIIGALKRENLKIRDGFFINDEVTQLKLIQKIRTYQPKWIIGNAPKDRHPDHGRAYELIKTASFLSGLRQIKTYNEEGNLQEAWRPEKVISYIQDEYIQPDFYVDISNFMTRKVEAIKAFKTQFIASASDDPQTYISNPFFLKKIEARAMLFGQRIGVEAAEGFLIDQPIGLASFSELL